MATFNWQDLLKPTRDIHGISTQPTFDPTGFTQGESTTTGPTPETEAAAYGTGFAGLAADTNFGRVSPEATSAYYDLAGQRAFGEGNERINAILAERGFGPSRVGQGAEMAGRLGRDIEINRTGAELGMAQQAATQQAALRQMIGQSRYGALTRGGTTRQNNATFAQPNPYAALGNRPSGLAPRSGMQNWSVGNWGTPSNLQRVTAGGGDPSRWEMAQQTGNPWAGKV